MAIRGGSAGPVMDTKELGVKIFSVLQGRHTTFVVFFAIAGNIMHWFHRLDGTYITYMATLMGFVLGHSTKESYFKDGQTPPPQQP
jgi:hypothetical protein